MSPTTAFARDGWEKIFETSSKEAHFTCALAGRDTAWTVGGIGIVAAGNGQTHNEQLLPDLEMHDLGASSDGTVYAVGSHGTVWRRISETKWHEEHQSRPPGTKAKRGFQDLLVGFRAVPYESKTLLVAHGPAGSPLIRDEKGSWQTPTDIKMGRQVVNFALFGPPLELPKNCIRNRWRWIDQRDGFAMCSDGRAFALLDGKILPAGKAPKACAQLNKVARRGNEIFAGCGEDGRLVKFAEGEWTTVPELKDIFALAGNDRCVFAASRYVVWRQCLKPSPRDAQTHDAGALK